MTGIYKITNIKNQKSYIGVSIDIEKRWQQHKSKLNKNQHVNPKLQNAWNLDGEENFIFSILEECPYSQCFEKEIEYIKKFNSFEEGYNLTRGGDKGNPEFFEKPVYVYDLSGNFIKEFYCKAEAERVLQCHSIKECCLKQCNRGYSKTDQEWYQYSYEYSNKISPFIFKGFQKEVLQLNQEGEIIASFISGADACRSVGASPNCHNLRDAIKTHKKWHNYYWVYADEYDDNWKPFNENTIVVFTTDGIEIGKFKNATDAAKKLSLDNSLISRILRGKGKTYNGYMFYKIKKD